MMGSSFLVTLKIYLIFAIPTIDRHYYYFVQSQFNWVIIFTTPHQRWPLRRTCVFSYRWCSSFSDLFLESAVVHFKSLYFGFENFLSFRANDRRGGAGRNGPSSVVLLVHHLSETSYLMVVGIAHYLQFLEASAPHVALQSPGKDTVKILLVSIAHYLQFLEASAPHVALQSPGKDTVSSRYRTLSPVPGGECSSCRSSESWKRYC